MKTSKAIRIISVTTLCAIFATSNVLAAPKGEKEMEDTKERTKKVHKKEVKEPAEAAGQHMAKGEEMGQGGMDKAHAEASKHHEAAIGKRDEMKASKEAIREAGPEAKKEAMAAMKDDKKAIKEAVKSGEMTQKEAKAAKKQTRWWQFWKSN